MNSIERSLVGVLIQENVELLSRDAEIRLIELIAVSPAERTIQSTLLNDGVEEKKSEKELLELDGTAVSVEELRLTDRRHGERVHQVVSKAFRSFIGHLNTVLEYRYREFISRVRGEPESEVTVNLGQVLPVFSQVFTDLFESAQPLGGQMTVLEHDPITNLEGILNEAFSLNSLTFTKRDRA